MPVKIFSGGNRKIAQAQKETRKQKYNFSLNIINMRNEIAVFENSNIRRHYDVENEVWFFSLVDIVGVLTDSVNPTDYLKKMRKRDSELNNYIGTNCPQVAMLSNGKKRNAPAGNVEQIFRLIQSIPSPKAEPFKQWLAI
jgi:DNA-damage-inducible protein D